MGDDELQRYKEVRGKVPTMLLLFALFSVAGWVYEIALESAVEKTFTDRGFLSGPYLPIYGFGLVMMLWVFSAAVRRFGEKVQRLPASLLFLLVAGAATALEYVTSVAVERAFGRMLWDYSRYPLNLNGRICLMASVFFGLGGLFCFRTGFPWILKKVKQIPERWQWSLASGISLVILADFIHTVLGASR